MKADPPVRGAVVAALPWRVRIHPDAFWQAVSGDESVGMNADPPVCGARVATGQCWLLCCGGSGFIRTLIHM
jgi:hypothetical protein